MLVGCLASAEPERTVAATPADSISAAPSERYSSGGLALATPQQSEPLPSLETLTNLNAGDLQALLGAPAFTRRDDPAQLWQYRGDRCTLDIFLYRPAGGGDFQVDYFAARPSGAAEVSTEACFHSVIAGGNAKTG